MINLARIFCVLTALLHVLGVHAGRSLVVAQSGDDKNIGTVLAPLKSISGALHLAKPGDTIFVRTGRYPAGSVIASSGTEGEPILIRNFPGERPLIDGRGTATSGLILDGVQYVTVRGFEIRAVGQKLDTLEKVPEWGGILLKDSSNCLIDGNVLVTGDLESRTNGWVGAPGIQLWSRSPHQGNSNNRIRGNDASMGWSGAHVMGPASGNYFEGNHFHHNREVSEDSDGVGQDNSARKFDTVTNKAPYNPARNTFRYNIFDGNADDGLDMWVSTENKIEFNIASNNGAGEQGDGNGYKMGPGGSNTVRRNLALGNRGKAFSNNQGRANQWSQNLAFANGSLGEDEGQSSQIQSEEHWFTHQLRKDVQREIENFRNLLVEQLPPRPPADLHLRGDLLVWEKADAAADGDEATAYLIYVNEELVGIETGTKFHWRHDMRGVISVCAIDDSYRDNQSDCTLLAQ